MTTLHLRKSISRSPLLLGFLLIPLVLACFALSPQARAVCQDACLTNFNTVQGDNALISNTTGTNNTVYGAEAMTSNQTGSNNSAYGAYTLLNSTVSDNTALGSFALRENQTGTLNTGVGESALAANTSGNNNTAVGTDASHGNNGDRNVAVGYSALSNNVTGSRNTVVGADAMHNDIVGVVTGNDNTAVGSTALRDTAGNNNLALGSNAGGNLLMGDNNILIANAGVATQSNTIRVGTLGTQTATYIAGIRGVALGGSQPVGVNAQGQLGVRSSSVRCKEAIKPMGEQSAAILSLRPVGFRYKKELDPSGDAQFGLVAEDVAKVASELVVRDEQGKPLSVRYEEVNAMLLNEFIKARRQIDAQEQQIEALNAGLQKVSAQLEASKPAPQVVNNP